jgi:hypothetical protein
MFSLYAFCHSIDPAVKRQTVDTIITVVEILQLHGLQISRYLPAGTSEEWIEFGVNEETAKSHMMNAGFGIVV